MRFCTTCLLIMIALPCWAQEAATKSPVPDAASQQTALQMIASIYKPDYEIAKTPQQKLELAKKLMFVGIATKDNVAGQFVLLRVARDIAAQQGDVITAFECIRQMSGAFEIDHLSMKLSATKAASKAINGYLIHQRFVDQIAPCIEEAIAEDQFEIAKSFCEIALHCADEGRDPTKVKAIQARMRQVEEMGKVFQQVSPDMQTLVSDPSNPQANTKVGRYLCLTKAAWGRGLKLLALGDDDKLKDLVLAELASSADPVQIGDQWWSFGQSLQGLERSNAEAHAAMWYRRALPSLSGLTKVRVEQLLEEVPNGAISVANLTEPMTAKNVHGKYHIAWRESTGNSGVSEYEFRADNSVWKGGRLVGTLVSRDGKLRVDFADKFRGHVILQNVRSEGFEGFHRWEDGNTTVWQATKLAIGTPSKASPDSKANASTRLEGTEVVRVTMRLTEDGAVTIQIRRTTDPIVKMPGGTLVELNEMPQAQVFRGTKGTYRVTHDFAFSDQLSEIARSTVNVRPWKERHSLVFSPTEVSSLGNRKVAAFDHVRQFKLPIMVICDIADTGPGVVDIKFRDVTESFGLLRLKLVSHVDNLKGPVRLELLWADLQDSAPVHKTILFENTSYDLSTGLRKSLQIPVRNIPDDQAFFLQMNVSDSEVNTLVRQLVVEGRMVPE